MGGIFDHEAIRIELIWVRVDLLIHAHPPKRSCVNFNGYLSTEPTPVALTRDWPRQ